MIKIMCLLVLFAVAACDSTNFERGSRIANFSRCIDTMKDKSGEDIAKICGTLQDAINGPSPR